MTFRMPPPPFHRTAFHFATRILRLFWSPFKGQSFSASQHEYGLSFKSMSWTTVDSIECINMLSHRYRQLLFFKMNNNEHYGDCSWKYNIVFLLFPLEVNTKFSLYFPQNREGSAWIHAGERNSVLSNRVVCSFLQVGSWLTPATNLPKASPLDSLRAFGASLLTLSKRRKSNPLNPVA